VCCNDNFVLRFLFRQTEGTIWAPKFSIACFETVVQKYVDALWDKKHFHLVHPLCSQSAWRYY
jgi:hypothetical protein